LPSRLTDHISSSYFSAANKLTSQKSRRRIVAYVESYDDIFFWRSVLSRFEDKTRYFEVMLPSKKNLSKGKKSVLLNLLSGQVGRDMLACVDADYDYLMQQTTATSRFVNGNPYVIHTYAYAIENYQCWGPSLHNICVGVTLNDRMLFDFDEYLMRLSETVFPLFVWSIWHYRHNLYHDFTMTDFNHVIETGNFTIERAQDIIQHMNRKVQTRVRQLQRQHPDAKESYLKLKEELRALGVTPRTTYLYIQGHHLFDNIVVPMLRKVCDQLFRERQKEIRRFAVHDTQRRNEMAGYTHSTADIQLMLRRNTAFSDAPPFKRLLADISKALGDDDKTKKSEEQ